MYQNFWRLDILGVFANTIAEAIAVYYSLVESAKLNNLNIYKYLNYLLDKLPDDIKNFDGDYEKLKLS